MECLLGSLCGSIFPNVMNCSIKHLNYLHELEENLNQLREKIGELNALRNDVKNNVDAQVGRMMTDQVKEWMQTVDARGPEVNQILSEGRQHLHGRCFNGCCPKNCWSSYKLGKQVAKKLVDVEKLLDRGVFPDVAMDPPPSRVQKLQEDLTVGLESVFERALNLLAKDDVKILGLYGVGGVGKTTLLKKINNEFEKRENDFDIVIWVVISSEVNIGDVQKTIWERMGLKQWSDNDSVSSHANAIFNGLDKKKFLILLDDLWQEIDLQNIGIPFPSAHNKSKIVLTTRNLDACGAMGAYYTLPINSLDKEQSWILFKEKVGEKTLIADPEIPKLAEKVAEKCDGLPLALITIGSSMANKTNPREWKRAISDLNKSATKFTGVERVLHQLKFSYDKLPSPTEQVCFLFCALYREDYTIYISTLIEKWIGAGYICGFEDFEDALNIGHSIIGTLKRTCLLELDDHRFVRMHDVVRELALWIARECGREEGKVCVKSGHTITELPFAAICPEVVQTISLIRTKITHFSELPNCPNLSTFFTPENYCLSLIVDDFFLSMPALKFLDLSNTGITKLPTSICQLFELEFLDLFNTKITSLPHEMRNLKRLKYLSLAEAVFAIPRGMLMNFSNLEILKLKVPKSGDSDEEMYVDIDELGCLNKLKALRIRISDFKDLDKFISNPRLCHCAKFLDVERCKEITFLTLTASPSSSYVCLGCFKQLEILVIRECPEIKEWILDGMTEIGAIYLIDLPKLIISWGARNLPCAHFSKLHYLYLHGCHAMVELTWLLLIPKLQALWIRQCGNLQEILSSSSDELGGAYDQKTTFSNLKWVELEDLPNLQTICSTSALLFPSLETIEVFGCPKLRRLPLNSNSATNTFKNIYGKADWWNGLQWENETTKTQFAKFYRQRDKK